MTPLGMSVKRKVTQRLSLRPTSAHARLLPISAPGAEWLQSDLSIVSHNFVTTHMYTHTYVCLMYVIIYYIYIYIYIHIYICVCVSA